MKAALGVGGGIAAYKAVELARTLTDSGASVQVVMTAAAQEFVRPLTFAALTGRKVITSMFSSSADEETLLGAVEHIQVALENDVLIVAPATADLLAKFAHGLANDFLTTLYLAFTGPVVLAPAMNTNMWRHRATQQNLGILKDRGHVIVEPEEGPLACGMTGPGRLADPARIAEKVFAVLTLNRDLEKDTVLVTAGPTQEPIDPIRFLSNRSSGRMGYALAEAAVARGAQTILISGPVHLREPAGVEIIRVRTAAEMREAVLSRLEAATIVVMAAAVADYRPTVRHDHKIKKTETSLYLELELNPDVLAQVGARKGSRLVIGFAAETDSLLEEARRKLIAKNCDMIVANQVGLPDTGFETEMNAVTLVLRTGEAIELPRAPKRKIADQIFDEALKLRKVLKAS
jgi:phosphopantothenoylcysteine decarboxylase/phosphopantothenate--cysteine ligase